MAVIAVLYILLIDGTAFVTCLLSVTRAIGIVFPFYHIRGKLLVILGIVVFAMMLSSNLHLSATILAVYNLATEICNCQQKQQKSFLDCGHSRLSFVPCF